LALKHPAVGLVAHHHSARDRGVGDRLLGQGWRLAPTAGGSFPRR
jgi:hypothetical protein